MGEAEKYLAEIISGKADFCGEPSNKPSYEELEEENKVLKAKLEELNKELARITNEIFSILFPASWGGTKWIKTRAKIRKYKYLKMKN